MPVSITKANVSHEVIWQMVFKAFGCEAERIKELTEGFFNSLVTMDKQKGNMKIGIQHFKGCWKMCI